MLIPGIPPPKKSQKECGLRNKLGQFLESVFASYSLHNCFGLLVVNFWDTATAIPLITATVLIQKF